MDFTSRTRKRAYAGRGGTETLLPLLADAIRSGVPRVKQIAQIASMMGDTEMRELAGDGDFPIQNEDRITWLIDGGYLSGFRVREWVCECLERNSAFVEPRAREGLTFARAFALGKHSWQELFGMAQTIESIDVPHLNSYSITNVRATNPQYSPKSYMTYAIASCLSMGNSYMKRALACSRMAAAATVKKHGRSMCVNVWQQEYDEQLKLLCKHLRAEAAQWAQ